MVDDTSDHTLTCSPEQSIKGSGLMDNPLQSDGLDLSWESWEWGWAGDEDGEGEWEERRGWVEGDEGKGKGKGGEGGKEGREIVKVCFIWIGLDKMQQEEMAWHEKGMKTG
jgi:hypothetical protein